MTGSFPVRSASETGPRDSWSGPHRAARPVATRSAGVLRGRRRLRHQLRQPPQVEGRAREDEETVDLVEPAELHLAQPRQRFQPPEDAFDPGPTGLTGGVARVARGAAVDGAAAATLPVLAHVRR